MEEENKNADPIAEPNAGKPVLGKFKSVDALVHAYGELEAEFTRRSQRLRALEEQLASKEGEDTHAAPVQEEPLRAPAPSEEERARIAGEYLRSPKGVPLMGEGGTGVVAPKTSPKSIYEAGDLALGYFKTSK